MTFDLSAAQEITREATLNYNLDGKDRPLKIVYKPETITPGMWADFTDASSSNKQAEAAIRIVAESAVSWDIVQKGQPVPVSEESVRNVLGQLFTNWLATQLVLDMFPKAQAAKPNGSRRGSSLVLSDEKS